MDQFVGQILLVPYTFAPSGWALCQGQLLPISQNTALFSLLGTFYGGDGRSTFALPNLQGMVAINMGTGPGQPQYALGQIGGEAQVTLLTTQIPAHTHVQVGTTAAEHSASPSAATFAAAGRGHAEGNYVAAPPANTAVALSPTALSATGGSQPHNNYMPSLCLNYIIALQGIFPARS